jgi:hypothetical protein
MLYTANTEPRIILIIYLGAFLFIAFCIWGIANWFSVQSPRVPKKSPEDLAQDEAWYRAEGRVLEAREEYLMKHASLQQTEKFIRENIGK